MEKYTVDLDKVLDEFEQHEDHAEELAAGTEIQPSGYKEFLNSTGDIFHTETITTLVQPNASHVFFPVTIPRYDYPFEPLEKLNLADADFAPSAKTVRAESTFSADVFVSNPSESTSSRRACSEPPPQNKVPGADLEHSHLSGGSDDGLRILCAFPQDRKSFEKEVDSIDKSKNLRPECSFDKETKSVDGLMGIVYNDTTGSTKTINVDLKDVMSPKLPKIDNATRNQVKNSVVESEIKNEVVVDSVENDEKVDEKCAENSVEVSGNMERSFSSRSDSFTTPVGFETNVDVTEEELERHLEEAEIELQNTSSHQVESDVSVTTMQETEGGGSSGEEYFSPVGESQSVDSTLDQQTDVTHQDDVVEVEVLDSADAGIHRNEENVEHNVVEKKPKKKKQKNSKPKSDVTVAKSTSSEISDVYLEAKDGAGDEWTDKRIIHDAINRELALKTKLPDVHSVKEQQNLEIKQQLFSTDVDVVEQQQENIDELSTSDEGGASSSLSTMSSKRQRPTSLKLPGVSETADNSGHNPTPIFAPPAPSLDFPTPANPNMNFFDLATPVVEESSAPPMFEEPETHATPTLWEGAETANTPVTSPTPVWDEADENSPQLGMVAPFWIPDSDAASCMQCNGKFTVIKRRHHCRACGQVLCAQCCGAKAKLVYMDNKEARVCYQCLQILQKVSVPSPPQPTHTTFRPNPNNPVEYCSIIPPLQQAQANVNNAPPTVLVPVGVLKREGSKSSKAEPKQVMFSDGIRPGGDLTELDQLDEPKSLYRRPGRIQKKVEKIVSDSGSETRSPHHVTRLPDLPPQSAHFIPDDDNLLPPIIIHDESTGECSINQTPDSDAVYSKLIDPQLPPVKFAINKNLFVVVKIFQLDCCINCPCWCFSTTGMCNVGQEELLVIMESLPEEKKIPLDIFRHFSSIYEEASQGNVIACMGYSIVNQNFLSSRDHGGFLYVRPTFQCLHNLLLPPSPYLVGILLQKWEIPWAKVFPIRLMLRLGAEFCYYPCPLVSARFRKPVFCEIGHTIMNLLADFRNYQYTLPNVRGMAIHMEDKRTRIRFPRNRYDELMKALNNSNDHVLALGSNFSIEADSHLVCVQNEEGSYQTQAINIQNKPRKITGASFVVFNGALKSSTGLTAKSSIVEDGLMIQIPAEKMTELRQCLRDMKDLTIGCGPINADQVDEVVDIEWVQDDKNFNTGVKSPIDDKVMDGIQSIRIHGGTDYVGEQWLIRWTEVFLIQTDETINSRRSEPVNISRLSEVLAQAFCVALTAHLDTLKISGLTKIALRATVDTENVGYEVGAMGSKLPAVYMNDLDSELVPVIHRAASQIQEGPITLELIFHILEQ